MSQNIVRRPGVKGLIFDEPALFDLGSPGRKAYSLPTSEIPDIDPKTVLPSDEVRDPVDHLPELTELDVVRHFTPPVAMEFQHRRQFLSARLLHHEVQPETQRRYGATARPQPASSLRAGNIVAGQSAVDVRVTGVPKGNQRHGCGQSAARRRCARRE